MEIYGYDLIYETTGFRKFENIQIPIMISFDFNKLPISFSLGYYNGFNLQVLDKGERKIITADPILLEMIEDNNLEGEFKTKIEDYHRNFNTGLIFQIESEIRISERIKLLIFARENHGLVDLIKNNNTLEWRINSFNFGTGLRIK